MYESFIFKYLHNPNDALAMQFLSNAIFLLTNLWEESIAWAALPEPHGSLGDHGDHCISGVVCGDMAEHWVIDQVLYIQSNLFVKMAGTNRQVPLQMLNHRAGLTTHPSIDFF